MSKTTKVDYIGVPLEHTAKINTESEHMGSVSKDIIISETSDIRDVVGALLIKVSQLSDTIQNIQPIETSDIRDYSSEIQQLNTQVISISEQINELNTQVINMSASTNDINRLTTSTQSLVNSIGDLSNRISVIENNKQTSGSNPVEWTKVFMGIAKLADYKETTLCNLPVEWKEARVEYKFKNSTQSEYVLIYNDIQSKSRKAYSLGSAVGDIVVETDGTLKAFNVIEPNSRILSVFYK